MYIRPKPGENEEDILRMQEEYNKEKNSKSFSPAASVTNLRPKRQAAESPLEKVKVSKYAQAKGLKTASPKLSVNPPSLVGEVIEKNIDSLTSSEYPNKNDDNIYYPTVIPSLLGNIVERNVDNSSNIDVKPMPMTGFPSVVKHDTNIDPGTKSIFSQNIDKQENPLRMCKTLHMDIDAALTPSTQQSTVKHLLNIPPKSYILNSPDSDHIHEENVEKLGSMSEQQILEEQQKLLSNLNPQVVSFLKSKRPKSSNIKSTQSTSKCIEENIQAAGDGHSVDDSLWDNDVLSHPQIHKWLNFNEFEKDKLAWIKGLTDSKINDPEKPYEARFNFEGYLMPYTVEYTEKTKTLFHHGDEPHRPGYTLSELFELTRSKVTQQRVTSLNILAGILEYYMAGAYKDIINLPLAKVFFVLRFALDENIVNVLEPALKGLRNLFYNKTDEASLDALVGFEDGVQQPSLENDKSEIDELDTNESELKDFHLAEIDLITAAYRTDIIQRIYYILKVLKPPFNCVHYSMQILIRLARDSVNMACTIIESEHLMTTIVQNFVPVNDINFSFQQVVYNKTPVLAALKLIRVMSLQSQEICNTLVYKHEVLKPICAYISCSVDGTYGLRIQIEAYCILSNLLHYGCGEDTTMALFPILATTLYRHIQGTDVYIHSSVLSATHASVVIQLLTRLYQKVDNVQLQNMKLHLNPLLLEGFQKWFTQISTVDVFTLGHLRLLCSITDCYRNVIQNEPIIIQYIVPSLKGFSASSGYKTMLSQLLYSSNILSTIEQHHVHTNKNLINLATCIVDTSLKNLPIINTSSPIPFFGSLFKLLECVNDSSLSDVYARSMWEYLEQIKTKTPRLCNNWFTRTEVDFLFSIIKLICLKKDLNESDKDLLYTVSNKLCYILRIDKKNQLDFLFGNIIFNKNFISAERLMKTISLSERSNISVATFSVNEIKSLYSKILNMGDKETGPNIVLKKWQEPILPRDWIYLPVLNLYSKSQDTVEEPKVIGEHARKVATQQDLEKTSIICSSLQWIIFNEHCFPDLLNDIDITDKFCRIMCVFLCDNSLFLNENVKALLKECIQILFKLEKEYGFNFSKPLTGLSNFQDFYTQFLEQFQSVSYGDTNFASCVLVPLAQKHNIKWRKLLWSEYAGCLRALDCAEEDLCYDLKEYLYPEETDMSLLKSYFNALSGNLLRPNTIAYTIAHHHASSFRNHGSSVET